jgi:hypothetical protein
MDNEGSLHVVWLNRGQAREPEFAVRFVRQGAVGSTAEPVKFLGEEALWAFLALSLSIGSDHVQTALSDLHGKGSAEIASLSIPDDDLRRLKLV